MEPISDALADKLRNSGNKVHIFQDDDKLHGSPELTNPFVVHSDEEHRGYDWMSLVNGDKVRDRRCVA